MGLRDRKVDLLSTEVIDFHGRQIKNAGDGVDDLDYVTVRQLNKAISGVSSSTISTPAGTGTGVATYVLEVLGNLAIEVNAAGKRVVTSSGKPSMIRFDLDDAPTGHTLDVDLYLDTVLYLSSSIPAGSVKYLVPSTALGGAGSLVVGSFLRLDITAVGSTNTGRNLYCTIVQ